MLQSYIQKFKFKSITTEDFINHFKTFVDNNNDKNMARSIEKKIDWQKWVYERGPPPVKMNVDLVKFDDDVDKNWSLVYVI